MDPSRGRPVRLGHPARLHRHHRPAGQGACARTSPSSPAEPPTSTAAGAPRCASTSPPRPRTCCARASAESAPSSPSRSPSTRRSRASTGHRPSRERGRRAAEGEVVPAAEAIVRVAVLKGGSSLERVVSLRSAARVEDALGELGHEAIGIDVGQDLVSRLRARAPGRRLHRAARPGRRGRHRAGAARDPRPSLHRAGGRGLRALHGQGRRQARDARRRAADPRLGRLQRDRVPGAGRRGHPGGDRGAARLPARDQAREPGLLARGRVRARPATRSRRRWSRPSATTTGSCSSAT